MPRYYKYRRAYKRIYPRKRWASNISAYTTAITVPVGQSGANSKVTVCENSAQAAVPTPVILKFGRLKISGDVRFTDNTYSNYSSCILLLH